MSSCTRVLFVVSRARRSNCSLDIFKTVTQYCNMAYSRNYFEDTGLLQPGHFNFQIGAPGPKYLKAVAGYLDAGSRELKQVDRFEESLQYGVAAGGLPVRQEVAKFLTRQYGMPVEWRNLFITAGATSGLEVLMKQFFTPEHIIFAENPCYPIFAVKINLDKLMRGIAVPMEDDGMNLVTLERELQRLPEVDLTDKRPFRAAVYVVPTFHNPTGICYSPEKCQKLVELSRKYDVLVICDDVYNTLSYKTDEDNPGNFEPAPKRLFAYDNEDDPEYKGTVISNGSFSKIIAPGLRLGFYEAPERVIKLLEDSYLAIGGGGASCYTSYVVAEALKNGSIDEHVQSLRVAHKARMATAVAIVEDDLSHYNVTITHPTGGYFLWLKLPKRVDAGRVLELAKREENVTFVKGSLASIDGDFTNCIRLCIAYYEVEEIREGVEKLCRCIETVIKEEKGRL